MLAKMCFVFLASMLCGGCSLFRTYDWNHLPTGEDPKFSYTGSDAYLTISIPRSSPNGYYRVSIDDKLKPELRPGEAHSYIIRHRKNMSIAIQRPGGPTFEKIHGLGVGDKVEIVYSEIRDQFKQR